MRRGGQAGVRRVLVDRVLGEAVLLDARPGARDVALAGHVELVHEVRAELDVVLLGQAGVRLAARVEYPGVELPAVDPVLLLEPPELVVQPGAGVRVAEVGEAGLGARAAAEPGRRAGAVAAGRDRV